MKKSPRNVTASDPVERFLLGMAKPEAYPHPVDSIQRLETHISWIFLAGDYAYKIKKPVVLDFLNFSTLEARLRFCDEELRINRRFAPELYLDVVAIRGSCDSPGIGGTGNVIECAVRMRRFAQEALASDLLTRGALGKEAIVKFAVDLANLHGTLQRAGADTAYGEPATILRSANANFGQIESLLEPTDDGAGVPHLRHWTETEFERLAGDFRDRRARGMTRECHGDLHLSNIVEWNGRLIAFDGIEFDPELRWIDVMSDVAFLVMDLRDRGAEKLAWCFLNAYLEVTGDYDGLSALRFYIVYRALVRGKIQLIQARQPGVLPARAACLKRQFRGYLWLATRCAQEHEPALVLMHGFSGSGKSAVAEELCGLVGAIRIRSDVERKRLHRLEALERSDSAYAEGIYGADASRDTYARLAQCATALLTAGYRVIVDASFLESGQRKLFIDLCAQLSIPSVVVDLQAPIEVLRSRVGSRSGDASEATVEVLMHQVAAAEPITAEETIAVVKCDSSYAVPSKLAVELAPHIVKTLRSQGPPI